MSHHHATHGHGPDGHHHHHDHSHAPEVSERNERVVLTALVLTASFMLVELVGGLL